MKRARRLNSFCGAFDSYKINIVGCLGVWVFGCLGVWGVGCFGCWALRRAIETRDFWSFIVKK